MKTSGIKKYTLGFLIFATAFLALLAVLSIWDVVSSSFLEKSVQTILVLGISSLLIVSAVNFKERDALLPPKDARELSLDPGRKTASRKERVQILLAVTILMAAYFLFSAANLLDFFG